MRVGVVSDTHGSEASVQKVIKAAGAIDLWLHAGDNSQDGELFSRLTGVPFFAAKGNCDGMTTAKIDEFVQIGSKKIWLTHGHRYGVKESQHELLWWAKDFEVHAVIYGHTHIPDCQWVDGVLLFNPGSVTYPRFGKGTFGTLDIQGDKIEPYLIEI